MKKRTITLYIITFVVIMCLPHLIFLVCRNLVDTTNYENRALYEAPVPGETPYKELPSTFESFYNDRLPFRNQLIALNNNIGYFIFGSTTGDRVMIGKDGWLFIEDKNQGNAVTNYNGKDTINDEELAQLAANLMRNKKIIEKAGMEFVIFVSPNKNRVYSEYMPDYMGKPAEQYQLKQIIEYLRANTNLRIVYDLDDIMEAKATLADRDIHVYNKVDTHWNNVGAYAGTKALLRELGIDMPDITELTITSKPNERCDLGGMLHLKDYFINKEVDYEVSGYETNSMEELEFDENDVISYTSNASDDRVVYVCRDSFAEAMGPYLGSQFKKVYMKHQNYYTVDDLEKVKPDVFVLETVERGAYFTFTAFDVLRDE